MGLRSFLRGLQWLRASWPKGEIRRIPVAVGGPPLAIIVICYEMVEQIRNTVRSLLPPYQQNIRTEEYEIRIIDNGSKEILPENAWRLGPNVHYQHVTKSEAPVNPGVAINRAVAATTSPVVCVMIDGARMVSPGVLRWSMDLITLSPRTVVEVRGWHLGPKLQMQSVLEGYNTDVEQGLLKQIDWPSDGYRLFEIAVPMATAPGGFFGRAAECTCLFICRTLFDEIGGYDERYAEPGGGLCNADFFVRAVQASDRVFVVLGEGTFHQIHGGAATGLSGENQRESFRRWKREYEKLSRPWKTNPVEYDPILAGHLPEPCRR